MAGKEAASSNGVTKICSSDPSQRHPNVDLDSTLDKAADLAASEAPKPLHSELSTEDGSEAVTNGCSSLLESSRLASQSSSSLSSSFDVSSSRASAPPPVTSVQQDIPQPDNQSVDDAEPLDAQTPMAEGVADGAGPVIVSRSLQSHPSFASTIVDDSPDNELFSQEEETTQVEKLTLYQSQPDEKVILDLVRENDQEHLPEPPASPTSNTLLSTSSGSTYGGESSYQPVITPPKKGKTPSANRLSISYAAGSRRLVVDAEVVEYLRVYRAEGRIEVHMSLEKDDEELKGVLVCVVSTFTPLRH